MAFRKRNQPGCPCCTPAVCTTDFHVDECGSASVGATVVVKTGSGTTVASGTTNGSGDVSLSLSGYVGQTLYVTVTHNTTYFDVATGVLLGNFCGRRYSYQLAPKTVTYGTACGTITLTTVACNGTTILGGKSWTLQKASAGGYTTYATGTTDASTGKSTITGVTYGGAFDGYRFIVTDATGTITGTAFFLTSTNCVASVVMRMSTVAGSPCTTPNDTVTLSGAGTTRTCQRGCCQTACSGITMAPFLQLSDPSMNIARTCEDTGIGTFSVTPVSGTALLGCPSTTYNACQWPELTKTSSDGQNPESWYSLDLSGGTPVLTVTSSYSCTRAYCVGHWWFSYCNTTICCGRLVRPCPPFGYCFISQVTNVLSAVSWTCNPFSATFTVPSILMQRDYGTNYPFVGAPGYFATLPSRTITITE